MTSLSPDTRLLLVGAGKMGAALLKGWLRTGVVQDRQVGIAEPAPSDELKQIIADYRQLTWAENASDLLSASPDIVVLAVKPQVMADTVADLSVLARGNALFLSIAAGLSVARLRRMLDAPAASVIRTMPNTPATIGSGITAFFSPPEVHEAHIGIAETLLNAVGQSVRLDKEEHMDAVTALSGSGPAYVFLFIEALVEAGRTLGLPDEIATKLAIHTLVGASQLAEQSELSPSDLREQVTSPHGTTAAALDVLMGKNQFKALVGSAVDAAHRRSIELNQG